MCWVYSFVKSICEIDDFVVRLPGGAQLSVTSANAARYVHQLADYRLNGGVVPLRLIRLFASPHELQMLIGGPGTSDTS